MEKVELQQFELKDRDLYLFGEIDNDMAFDFVKSVNTIIQKDKEICENNNNAIKTVFGEVVSNMKVYDKHISELNIPDITVHLNSVGGLCYEGFAIYDALQRLNKHCKVNIIVTGTCMSMAIPVVLSVPFEQRKCTKYTTFLIHQCSSIAFGKSSELEDEAKECKRLTNWVYDIIIDNTAITKEELSDNYDKRKDWILTADQALENKIISEVI